MRSYLDIALLYIEYGRIGQFFISDYITGTSLFGNSYPYPDQPRHIYCATQALSNAVLDPEIDNDTLMSLAEYQFSLYSAFITDIKEIFDASNISMSQFSIAWGWSITPFTPDNLPLFNYQKSGVFEVGTLVVNLDYTEASANNYLAMRYPSSMPDYTQWHNSTYIYGQVPDQVFNSIYTSGEYSYVYSRVIPALPADNKQIAYS